ncbi:MAG: nitroreductase [Streptococcaceae bacterium]|jgi:nitroreductase|nr:nitroreductase [Streptococcaceae bacterium]
MNETLHTISTRFACRDYSEQSVEQEKIERIIKSALQSPSALNRQPWKIIAISNKKLLQEINDHVLEVIKDLPDQTVYQRTMDRGGNPYYHAPVMFLILRNEMSGKWDEVDCGIVAQNMSLAATSLGLGNVIAAMTATAFEGTRKEEFKAKVNWPKGYVFGMGLLVGYANSIKVPHEIDSSKVIYVN